MFFSIYNKTFVHLSFPTKCLPVGLFGVEFPCCKSFWHDISYALHPMWWDDFQNALDYHLKLNIFISVCIIIIFTSTFIIILFLCFCSFLMLIKWFLYTKFWWTHPIGEPKCYFCMYFFYSNVVIWKSAFFFSWGIFTSQNDWQHIKVPQLHNPQ